MITIDLNNRQTKLDIDMYDITKLINKDKNITKLVFKTDGYTNFLYFNDEKEAVAGFTPKIVEKFDNHYFIDITTPSKYSENFILNDETITDGKILEEFWRKQLYSLFFKRNQLIHSYLPTHTTIKKMEQDYLVLEIHLSRTMKWEEDVSYFNPILHFLEKNIELSCTSGYVKTRESSKEKNVFEIAMSVGNHSASAHPSRIDSLIQSYADNCMKKFIQHTKEDGINIHIKFLRTDKNQWHDHIYKVTFDVDEVSEKFNDIDYETHRKLSDKSESFVPKTSCYKH